ncbi:MAG: hypothetical protein JWM89_3934 [Acidimicrobiales bacterium]|nr:hypothetical protein [Acidimicrobiales bacterium]
MTRTEIVVARHWRAEVADVADTLRAALAADGSSEARVLGGGRWPKPSTIGRRPDVLLLSDVAAAPDAGTSGAPRIVRIWWNGADEVRSRLAGHPAPGETHVVFFPDVAAALADDGLDLVYVPYAFAAPTTAPSDGSRLRPAVGCTGEVDISTTCFEGFAGQDPADLGAAAAAMAEEVVMGATTLLDADAAVHVLHGHEPRRAHAMLWSVRNHVRYRIVAAVAEAFPTELSLRGDDWKRLGFAAEPTDFNRRRRRAGYREHRVSLDPGSKSTHAALYPRSVEIIAMAGGIAQFDTGDPLPTGARRLEARRPDTLAGMVEVVGGMLDADADSLAAANRTLQQEYAMLRLDAGRRLLAAIIERVS